MLAETFNTTAFLSNFWFAFHLGLIAFAILYFFFSLIVLRQINLMTDTLITEVAPFIRILGIVHAIFALSVVLMLIFFT